MLAVLGKGGLRWVLDCAPVFSTVLHGIETALAERSSSLIVRQAATWQMLRTIMQHGRPDGLVLMGDDLPGNAPHEVSSVANVWVMGSPWPLIGDHVQPDHLQCGILAARWAMSHGHRHCAVIGSALGSPLQTPHYRNDAFRWAISGAGGTAAMLLDPALISVTPQENRVDEHTLGVLLDRLLAMDPRPTAVLSQADLITPCLYRMLLERGVRPQEDITVISINNEHRYLAGLRPRPVIVDLQAESIGRRAVEQLMWRIEHPSAPAMRIMVEPVLILPAKG